MLKKIYSEDANPWDGNASVIPENGTLVAINTASSGLVNMLVCGYRITYHDGNPQIRILVKSVDGFENERFLQELEPPLTIRERALTN